MVYDSKGRQSDIKDYIENLGWEENEKELAVRISFTARNDKTSRGYLSSFIVPGVVVAVFATDGKTFNDEVARGNIEKWNPQVQNSSDNLKCICYDDLYKLQKSQDNVFLSEGTSTKSAIKGLMKDWGYTLKSYDGPDVTHSKQVLRNKYQSDIILTLLDDAVKKSGEKSILRAKEGYPSVIRRGSNSKVYVFQIDNIESVSRELSTENLVTRVKVVGQADDDGNTSVEAVLNGLTKYGIRQRIYTRGSDTDLASAKSAAQEILDENGKLEEKVTVQSPDVPFIRKGDLVYLILSSVRSYYFVKSITHDASTHSMTMQLEIAEKQSVSENKVSSKKEYKVGDIVDFNGGTHYVSSTGSKGYKAKAGKAKITKKRSSAKHPYHLIHEDRSSNVYGWVDKGTFS